MLTPQSTLLLAILLQGFLAFALLFWLGMKRLPRLASGEVVKQDISLSGSAWPEDAQKASNAFDNQFQLPIFLYVFAGVALYITPHWLDALLALSFVISRYCHAGIHITTNHLNTRFLAYVTGFAILTAWWVFLVIRVLNLSGGAA